jgi:hypothetical protein
MFPKRAPCHFEGGGNRRARRLSSVSSTCDFTGRPMRLRRLKTVEGVRWTMAKEERAAKGQRTPSTASDPTGLF